jgi:Protein of unknown function (DUF4013)
MKNLGKAFSFFFKDPSWVTKTLIAAGFMILSLVGLGIPVLAGYHVQIAQRVMRREEHPLPPWTDVGVQFIVGLKYCVVYLIYLLPILLLFIPVVGLIIAGAVVDDPGVLGAISTLYLFAVMFFVVLYSLALSVAAPIILYRFAKQERISDALDIGGVFRDFKRNWQNALVVALLSVGVHSFAFIGIFFFLIGVFLTIFYAYGVSAYLAGLLYLERPSPEATV